MRKFIKKALLFFIIGIGLAYFTNFIIILLIHQVNIDFYGDLNKVTKGTINADILFTGSSRTHVHFNPTIVDSVLHNKMNSYNLGQDGEQLTVQLGLIKTYLKYNKPPKVIIQGLDLFTAGIKKDVVNKWKYFPYLNQIELFDALSQIDRSVWIQKYIPLYGIARFNENIRTQFINEIRGKKNKIKGFFPRYRVWDGKFDAFKRKNSKGRTFPINDEAIAKLDAFIMLCKENNIHLIFAYPPEYYQAHELTLNREEIFKVFLKLSKKNNIPFWDYSNEPISFKKKYFYNAQHLNAKGADIFSHQLAQRLKGHLQNMGL